MNGVPKVFLGVVLSYIVLVAGCASLTVERPEAIQRGEVVFLGKGSVQRLHSVQMNATDLAIRAQAGTILPTAAPQNYPTRLSWRPLRHFGPFFKGSDITQVQVGLNERTATWYYNEFLATHEDTAIFKRYYGSSVPTNRPPSNVVPGTFPSSNGFNDIVLSLQRVSYSSRYGGTVELKFKTVEDYEVEVRKDTTLWDIGTLEMNAYVVPVASSFNPNYLLQYSSLTYLEFVPQEAVAYELAGEKLTSLPDNNLAELNSALKEIAGHLLTNTFTRDASRFVHAFVHSQFKDYIGPTDKVDIVEITDDFLDLHTRQGEVVFTLDLRISNINLDTEPGDEEITVTVDAMHMFDAVHQAQNPLVGHEFEEINNGEGTSFHNFGIFKIEECDALKGVMFTIRVVENDDLSDDRFDATFHQVVFNCSNLRSRANDGTFGLVSENTTEGVLVMHGDNVEGALGFVTRVSLLLR